MNQRRHDPERIFDLDLVRCTENAALAAWKYFGKGDKNQADYAASDAIRGMFSLIDCQGLVRIGEGRKDDAPGIFTDEKLGAWQEGAIPAAIALDPIDGTTLTAKGLPGAISVLAVATCKSPDDDPRKLFPSIPSHYMEKFAVGQAVTESDVRVQLDAPLETNLSIVAGQLHKRVRDLVVVVLDRPRHDEIIKNLREIGCRVRLISDGDVAAAIAPSLPDSGVDAYVGIGGSPEAVIAAAAIKCLGGQQFCRIWPKDEQERNRLLTEENCSEADLNKVWNVNDMAPGDNLIFAATGISDSPMLRGINYRDSHCVTHSILMRARNRTVRHIEAYHDLKLKTVRLHSTGEEISL
ncbi:class II fructose-bisphosphatase [Bythopirellula goksoeyrii]|uniref:Fructose-1,6-bisphosphatase n=1 Tax=Bythopirellula goksoeyrii TaxID=1400387 RepID=A0A5B9QHV9_9BACT|nr:class II fructose-bisphosphatase [Bythopirellula goksoeyrii]QEG33811.1 Fructose-1,6-bisphosphatase class 2 [Bythopirellula goksoeyrii]